MTVRPKAVLYIIILFITNTMELIRSKSLAADPSTGKLHTAGKFLFRMGAIKWNHLSDAMDRNHVCVCLCPTEEDSCLQTVNVRLEEWLNGSE